MIAGRRPGALPARPDPSTARRYSRGPSREVRDTRDRIEAPHQGSHPNQGIEWAARFLTQYSRKNEIVSENGPTTADRIRRVLSDHGRLSSDVQDLDLRDDLYQAGMTSHASVNVMLALEGEFDVEFPDAMLRRSVFASIAAIEEAVVELLADPV